MEDCSLRAEIQLTITADAESFTEEGELITFTFVVKNSGGVKLEGILVSEYLSYNNWNIPALEPSEEKTFTISYSVGFSDVQNGYISFTADASGIDRNGVSVYSTDQNEILGIFFPPGFLDYEITSSHTICQPEGTALGLINIDFGKQKQSGIYTAQSVEDGKKHAGDFDNKSNVQIKLPAGDYTLEIGDTLGQLRSVPGIFTIVKTADIIFDIPTQVKACGEYLLASVNEQDLVFKLIAPDWSEVYPNPDFLYPVIQSGTYQITGMDPNKEMCAVQKTFEAEITLPAILELEVLPYCSEDTFATISLLSDIKGQKVSWYNVGSDEVTQIDAFDNSTMLIV
ncbi:DUF7507 domain-containing protein [Algoriphagus antarcticus]|uniref:Putative repeat protein (TIGR01451 family) n=1 Tax=Algoriphagus antarcticus TaxID=238540 RepID=A0A3E0D6S0_9BACT|nr:CARDB domain-containing protein [Algoriphagus antarcticus]REG78369.1 putative repeat protein (TIGR01451 family) [Algoriphagus antarcticus]